MKEHVFIIAIIMVFLASCDLAKQSIDKEKSTRIETGKLISEVKSVKLGKIPASAEIVYHSGGALPGGGGSYIFVMDKNGNTVTQITFETPRNYEHAAVSYDKRRIVANEIRPEPSGTRSILWLYDLVEGAEANLVPEFYSAGGCGMDWDPDGYIYFAAHEKKVEITSPDDIANVGRLIEIYRIKFDGTDLKKLTDTVGSLEADVSVSEDGDLVASANAVAVGTPQEHPEIWVMNSDGTNSRSVHKGGPRGSATEGAHDPEISPDNKKVVFSKVNNDVPPNWPDIPGLNTAHDIWIANLDGTGLTRVTKPGSISIIPDWQGNLIVFTELNEKDNYKGASIINMDGTGYKRIKAGANSPKWIPKKK